MLIEPYKKYLGKIVISKYGTLKECIEFIKNRTLNNNQYISLELIPNQKTIYRLFILEL